jgi:hypothetical protein
MSNIKENDGDDIKLIGKTIKDDDNNSTALIILKEFVKALKIERSKVSISLLDDFSGDGHLVVSKYYREIVTD